MRCPHFSLVLFSGALIVVACDAGDMTPPIVHKGELLSDLSVSATEIVFDRRGVVIQRQVPRVRLGYSTAPPKPSARPPGPAPLPEKVHPRVRTAAAAAKATDTLDVVVMVKPDTDFHPLPELDYLLPRSHAVNQARLADRRRAFEKMAAPRREKLDRWAEIMTARGAQIVEGDPISSSVRVRLRPDVITALAAEGEISSVTMSGEDEKPPADNGNIWDDPIQARFWTQADNYITLGYHGLGYIALLDTGVRKTHVMVQDHVDFTEDCHRGGANCNDNLAPGYNPLEVLPNLGDHGAWAF